MDLVHVYPPHLQHSDAFLVGTPEGLKALRDAIDRALTQQYSMTELVCNDGEWYNLFVVGLVGDDLANRLQLPYTASFARRSGEDVVRPGQLLTTQKYQDMLTKQKEQDNG